jgi:dTDP-4-dehydrorhamnose reductase
MNLKPNLQETHLVIGIDGLIGNALRDFLLQSGKKVIGTTRRKEFVSSQNIFLDLSQNVRMWKPEQPVSVAYFCAGITSLEQCRIHPEKSLKINVEHTFEVIETLVAQGAFVLFPSTNLVYDGSSSFQNAQQQPTPHTISGQHKAEIEKKLLAIGNSVSIVRITKVFGSSDPLLQNWIARLKHNQEIFPFLDKVVSPLYLPFVVQTFYQIAHKRLLGITQISGERDITYADLAYRLAQKLGVNSTLVRPIPVQQSGLSFENNPLHTTLDCTRLISELNVHLSVWEAVDLIIKDNLLFFEGNQYAKS